MRDGKSQRERQLLGIWRGGAVRTGTRRFWAVPNRQRKTPDEAVASASAMRCRWCGAERESAKHLWAECERFAASRRDLAAQQRLPAAWWAQQPRVTSATGWVPLAAADDAVQRGRCMVAACQLGILITDACSPDHD